jgi:hypothetical protein
MELGLLITIRYQYGSDSMVSLTVHGHGGSNAASALDTTAAGDLWDNSLGIGNYRRFWTCSKRCCKWKQLSSLHFT